MKKYKEPQILGEVFSPCFMTEEEYEAGWKTSMFYVESDYMEAYRKHLVGMSHVASIAKSYIVNHWTKVKDWSDLNIIVTHGPTGKSTEYYKYAKVTHTTNSKVMADLFKRVERSNKRKHNPIVSFNAVILDPTDGDFSVTINGTEHWWITDEEVIVLADYIEKQLKKEKSAEKEA